MRLIAIRKRETINLGRHNLLIHLPRSYLHHRRRRHHLPLHHQHHHQSQTNILIHFQSGHSTRQQLPRFLRVAQKAAFHSILVSRIMNQKERCSGLRWGDRVTGKSPLGNERGFLSSNESVSLGNPRRQGPGCRFESQFTFILRLCFVTVFIF